MNIPTYRKVLLVPLLASLITSCTESNSSYFKGKLVDQPLKLNRSDYEKGVKPDKEKVKQEEKAQNNEPPIPELAPMVSAPQAPKVGQDVMVSLAVTDDVPIRDVMIELARLANVDLEMGRGIKGGVIFKAHNRPFSEVIGRVAELAGLRYSLSNGVLKVEVDEPYLKNHQIDFLNIERSSEGTVSVSTNVLGSSGGGSSGGSSGGGGGGGAFNTGSSTSVSSKSESDLWKSFESSIKQIISSPQQIKSSSSSIPSQVQNHHDGEDESEVDGGKGGANRPLQAAVDVPADSGGGTQSNSEIFYVINKQAGILTVKAPDLLQRKVADYLEKLKASASSQVLIEAKIVEVTLDKKFQSGINWNGIVSDRLKLGLKFSDFEASSNSSLVTLGLDSDGDFGANIDAIVQLLEQFGTSRTPSSPRVNAINNQQAVLTFAKNQVYFEIEVQREQDTSSSTNQELLTVDSEIKTVPIGIILNLQPSIDALNNEITLSVRPTLSRVTEFVEDPAVAFLSSIAGANANIPANKIPVVEVRELDSILKMKSGQVMVLGGLMEDKSSNTDKGMPGLSEIPVVGNAFKSKNNSDQTVELVIFIKATIVPTSGQVHRADKELYDKFTNDPRPINFNKTYIQQ